jgi:phosphonate transport system ATP-binding protein
MTQTPLITLTNDDIGYSDTPVLKEVTLQVKPGEKIALIGRSGSGKTSLLRRLYGLYPERCSFIHQHHVLVPQLSVFHNIYMGRLDHYSRLHNIRNLIKPDRRRVLEVTRITERLDLSDKLYTRTGELSGGQQQRVGVGRALYRGGDILMADEPVSSLDEFQGREIISLITSLGSTVISALHYVELSREFFNRIIGLGNNRIMFDLPAAEVTDRLLGELYA